MQSKVIYSFLIIVFINWNGITVASNGNELKDWIIFENSDLPDLPDSLSLGGAFIGVIDDVVIIAGGSNFDRPVWEGGKKVYHDSIVALVRDSGHYRWKYAGKLPYPVAHGATVATDQSLILLGGENSDQKFDKVLQLQWDRIQQEVSVSENWPSLPKAISYHSAALLNNSIYVAGGKVEKNGNDVSLNNFWRLELGKKNEWQELIPWPGKARFGSLLVKQTNGEHECLYLFSGKFGRKYLTDAYRYDPKVTDEKRRWEKLAEMPRSALLAPMLPIGTSQIYVFSGSDGHDVDHILEIGDGYQFVKDVLSYNTITDVWHQIGEMPTGIVGSKALMWDGKIIIPGGEIRPSVRTPKVLTASIRTTERGHLTGIDYLILFIYLGLMVLIGYYFSSYNKTTNDYFLGGQKIPFWAAGLSLMATQVSSIGFMSVPAKAFATNWSYFAGVFTWIIAVPIVIHIFIPFYRKLNVVSAYEYLAKRFNSFISKFVAGLYLLFQLIGRMSVIIYLPAIALSAVTALDARQCIIIIGVLATAYTVLGGMHAVIWTDVAQSLVIFGGIILCIGYVLFSIDGGLGEFIAIAQEDQKFSFGSMEWDHTAAVFWIIIIGNIFNRTSTVATDQTSVQRYLTTRNEKEAGKALWTDVAVSVPWALFVFLLGTALYVFYKVNPEMLAPTLSNDGIVPFFIGQNLPSGISGLLIAAIFAASMSSVDSSIHSSTTVLMRDFLQNIVASKSESNRLLLSRLLTIGLGVFATIMALVMTLFDITSVWDVVLEFASFFTGAMTGLFVLGIFTTRANSIGAAIGAVGSALILFYVSNFTPLHFFLYSGIGIISSVIVGYLASFLFKSDESLAGLTWYTLAENN